MKPVFVRCAAAVLLSAASATFAAGEDTFIRYTGTATALRGDKFLYHEEHVMHFHGGQIADRVVLYTCRDGTAFARKTVSYVDELSPDFLLEDASNGMRQGSRTDAKGREILFRGNQGAEEKTGSVPRVAGSVADAGFDGFVRLHWQELMDGHALGMKFLVPSRLEELRFKVEHVNSAQMDGTAVEVFRLKLSGVWGLVGPSIDVYYSANEHVLIRYVGVSDLLDTTDHNFQANIDFPPRERRSADAASMATARRASIAPCR